MVLIGHGVGREVIFFQQTHCVQIVISCHLFYFTCQARGILRAAEQSAQGLAEQQAQEAIFQMICQDALKTGAFPDFILSGCKKRCGRAFEEGVKSRLFNWLFRDLAHGIVMTTQG